MAKEIVETTHTTDSNGLLTKIYFDSKFNIKEKRIKGIIQAIVETYRAHEPDTDIFNFQTDNKITTAKGITPIIRSVVNNKYEDAVSAHFEMVNKIKQLYFNQT